MSKVVDTDIDCPGCLASGPVSFDLPTITEPSRTQFDCKHCESSFRLQIIKPIGSRPTECKIFVTAEKRSRILQKMLHVKKIIIETKPS